MSSRDYDVIIAGGGPSGASAATLLAEAGVRVLVIEEKRMPRHKVCGEFITSESFPTLDRLRVKDRLLDAGAQDLNLLRLVASSGKVVETPIADMSRAGASALSLSRAKLDQILLERAREVGAECLEGTVVKQCLYDAGMPCGVEAMTLEDGKEVIFNAPIIIDASGRNSRLMVRRDERAGGKHGSRLYALKAHFENVNAITDQVELYFFPQGYGGLSRIEDGRVNLCFITNERAIKAAEGDRLKVVEKTVMENRLARERLRSARVVGKWLSAGPLTFGTRRLSQNGILALGDASGMIDPFTGTGIQIALRTGEMAADSIVEALDSASRGGEVEASFSNRRRLIDQVIDSYRTRYGKEFGKRMKVAEVLRNAAFSPTTANYLATLLGGLPWVARRVLKATRS
jgi:geranylgeranyl reductase family protein